MATQAQDRIFNARDSYIGQLRIVNFAAEIIILTSSFLPTGKVLVLTYTVELVIS
jgi:hypothetical protein